MPSELQGAWPYERENPDLVVLGPRPGTSPSPKPPVRIFLGTEEGQYRAERVFVFSVERWRDPARTYEIHLMKNLAGFSRKGWRTGFTCYRFAIPDLAGRAGRAIYNDVDQIYLADPGLLFDLELGDHGYLAIDARDTSVMLIDCQKMLPWWNRPAASLGKKGELTNVPAAVPGLWGVLEPHWNARDLEYVEGRTRCLHYTALHQQPWHPFPEQYSYHANPLAYLWHDLEREADEAGFQVFSADAPSPGFQALARLEGGEQAAVEAAPVSAAGQAALAEVNGSTLIVSLHGASLESRAGENRIALRLVHDPRGWPREPADTVIAAQLFERLPPGDIGWVLDRLFDAAGELLYAQVRAQAAEGLGSPRWWARRLELAGAGHPATSWHLDVVPAEGSAPQSFGVRRLAPPHSPTVWVLTGGAAEADRQALQLAEALGWSVTRKRLVYSSAASLPNLVRGASLVGIDRAASDPIDMLPPDLVIAADRRSVPVARWLRTRSGGRTRLVQLGRPAAPFELFDLIIATPDQRLPIRRNVLQVAAPLGGGLGVAEGRPTAEPWLNELPQPRTALFLTVPGRPYRLDEDQARELGRAANAGVRGGSLLVWVDPAVPTRIVAALKEAISVPYRLESGAREASEPWYGAVIANAQEYLVHAGDPASLAEVCLSGRPVALLDLPRWTDSMPLTRVIMRFVLPLIGGKTYRGTPLQQHFPGRLVDWLVTRGIVHRPTDYDALHRALEARGLLRRLEAAEPIASPRPLDDLARSVARVRGLLSERAQPA